MLTGKAKTEYQRDYMRRRRRAAKADAGSTPAISGDAAESEAIGSLPVDKQQAGNSKVPPVRPTDVRPADVRPTDVLVDIPPCPAGTNENVWRYIILKRRQAKIQANQDKA